MCIYKKLQQNKYLTSKFVHSTADSVPQNKIELSMEIPTLKLKRSSTAH